MVSDFTSACCTPRLGPGNVQERTHSETSSNYRCTNDGCETGALTPSRARGRPRSDERREAVLKAEMELMPEDDLRRASDDRISARSGVTRQRSTNGERPPSSREEDLTAESPAVNWIQTSTPRWRWISPSGRR